MLEYIKSQLSCFGIEEVRTLPLSMCRVTRAHKLEKCGFGEPKDAWVVIFAIPYYTEHEQKNISSYCIPRDYHLFCDKLFGNIIPILEEHFSGHGFFGFSDNSPIDERHAAALSGLGIIGENKMLITEKYSSYVFLGEIITDLPLQQNDKYEIAHCEGCGKCLSACPMQKYGECLSAITQKKGELTDTEREYIKKYGSAWGCDICQEICPHTIKAKEKGTIFTNIDFFKRDLTPCLTTQAIAQMSDGAFFERAYSWRKKSTILRNLDLIEK